MDALHFKERILSCSRPIATNFSNDELKFVIDTFGFTISKAILIPDCEFPPTGDSLQEF